MADLMTVLQVRVFTRLVLHLSV